MARILIADDVESLRAMLRLVLEQANHDVTEVSDGGECLEMLAKHEFDLVLTDVLMPGMDGIEAIKRLRAANSQIKIIAMSGGTQKFPAASTLKLTEMYGADRTLFKPFANAELLQAVDDLLAEIEA